MKKITRSNPNLDIVNIMAYNTKFGDILSTCFPDIEHCLRRRDTQRIDLSAKAHHDRKVRFVLLRGMHYPKHLC